MSLLFLPPLPLASSSSSLQHHQLSSPNPISSFSSSPSILFFPPSLLLFSSKSFTACSSNNINKGRNQIDGSSFLDEDGVVEDMDGYLNHLSLEYDSVWDTKPSWCQPWTILLTGVTVVTCSWLFLHSTIISAGVLFIISAWWYIFLYAYPKAYAEMIAERRKKVTSGVEDTFGLGNGQ